MKVNTETTKLGRLRFLLGGILAASGLFLVIVVGGFFGYTNTFVWAVGFLLLVAGLLLAGSARLIAIFQELMGF